MSQSIKIAFTDFWHEDGPAEVVANPLYQMLSRYYNLELSEAPDFLIYSCFGHKYLKYDCTRIFFTGENVRPNFKQCDYAFSFDFPVTDRNYRLPLYCLYEYFDQLRNKTWEVPEPSARKFCNFVYSNRKARERIEFFKLIARYKPVDSGGKVMNNVGGRVGDKLEFLRNYKFTITFENSSHPGYTTEKIMEALIADTIPIYWGNPLVSRDFNPDCFINCHDFDSLDEVVKYVEEVDNDDELYRSYLTAPAFVNGVDNEFVNEDNVKRQFSKIFSGTTKSQVAGRYDFLKYCLHPSRPEDYARSLVRRWRAHKRGKKQ